MIPRESFLSLVASFASSGATFLVKPLFCKMTRGEAEVAASCFVWLLSAIDEFLLARAESCGA